MTVTTIASIAAGLTRTAGNTPSKANAVLNSLFTPASSKSNASDVTNLSAALNLQNQVAQFRVASQNVAQASSVLASAEGGASEIARQISRMKDIALRAASSDLSETERAQLISEFQAIRNKLNTIVQTTRFNNEVLLDGHSSQLKVNVDGKDQKDLSVGGLTERELFKNVALNVSNPDAAKAAQKVLAEAETYAKKQLSNIQQLQDGLELASASLQTAIQNQDALRSNFDESDFTTQLLSAANGLTSDDVNSLFAQTNKMPGNILQLLSE